MGKFQKFPDGPWAYPVDTSIEGAEKAEPWAKCVRDKVLRAVAAAGATGLTVLECCEQYQLDRHGAQPRFTELRIAGKIVDSGMRRRNPSGVRAIVWVLPEYVRKGEGVA